MPDIVQRIEYKIQNPKTSLIAVAKLIETEPVLTGRILKLANSVMYSGGRAESKSLSIAIVWKLSERWFIHLPYPNSIAAH